MAANKYDNIDDLLVKTMLGEASPEEEGLVKEWLALDEANQSYYDGFRTIWERSRKFAVKSDINEGEAWDRFKERVDGGRGAIVPGNALPIGGPGAGVWQTEADVSAIGRRGFRVGWRNPWLRAAVVAGIVVFGGWLYFYRMDRFPEAVSIRSGGAVLTDTLSEGTVVTLNKQSSIRYGRRFTGKTRLVEMEGEAFFTVSTDKEKPFVVRAGGVSVTVLGTSFNVKTAADSTEIVVETGMVEVGGDPKGRRDPGEGKGGTDPGEGGGTGPSKPVVLRPGEKLVLYPGRAFPVKEQNTDELYNYYITHEFVCRGIPLSRLVEKLNEVYKTPIVIGDERLAHLSLTTTFRDESLDEILGIISKTLKLSVVREEGKIILR